MANHFDDDAFNFVICPICCEVFQGPVLQCVWGHSFCGECISQWLCKKASCPQCRKPLNKTSLCRNLMVEQAIEELVNKNHLILPPIKPHNRSIEIGIPVLSFKTDTPPATDNKTMVLKIVGCNVIFLAIIFAAVAALADEEIARNAEVVVANKEHIPIQIVFEELVYHIGTGVTLTMNFLCVKGVLLLKILIQCISWILTKSFVLASFVEEYGILLLRFVGTLMLTIIVGLGRCVWYASQVLVETSQMMTNV